MIVLLIAAAAIYLAIDELGEVLLLAGFAGLTIALVVFQERRSGRALEPFERRERE